MTVKKCLRCENLFFPTTDKILVCDRCIGERNNQIFLLKNPPVPTPKPTPIPIPKLPRKKHWRTHCKTCNRKFKQRLVEGYMCNIRIEGKYCTKLCKDYDKQRFKKYENDINYSISKEMVTPKKCKLCKKKYLNLHNHVVILHGMTMEDYNKLK